METNILKPFERQYKHKKTTDPLLLAVVSTKHYRE